MNTLFHRLAKALDQTGLSPFAWDPAEPCPLDHPDRHSAWRMGTQPKNFDRLDILLAAVDAWCNQPGGAWDIERENWEPDRYHIPLMVFQHNVRKCYSARGDHLAYTLQQVFLATLQADSEKA
ncbi:hypothetical protein [Sulfobacillus thermosulfidooxidans]|uniref:hypothetical protein n=1 Tax=Sulfobacillus thermosulfidooxidans TaxID=28034 RepID=UPI0006B6004C|nr:hypothetical protein [Sulfobacillus thermosulfidooxidans]